MAEREGQGRGAGPGRALLWVGVGVVLALVAAAALTPAGAYDLGTILPLLALIAIGTAITVVAGARGRRNEADRRLLARLEDAEASGAGRSAPGTAEHDDRIE